MAIQWNHANPKTPDKEWLRRDLKRVEHPTAEHLFDGETANDRLTSTFLTQEEDHKAQIQDRYGIY